MPLPNMLCPRCWGSAKDPDTGAICTSCKGAKQIPDQQLTDHFKLSEMLFSDTAVRLQIPNNPDDTIVRNLTATANYLEQLRAQAGVPLHVNSGYRCRQLNTAIKGSPTSAHCYGFAADILPQGMGRKDFMELCLRSGLPHDQFIYEGTWVHVGVTYPQTGGQRDENLMAFPGPNGMMAYFPYDAGDPRVV